jgi:hypothetical protein
VKWASSEGIFLCHFIPSSMVCLSTFSLINTVYARWWIIQSHASNRCLRIQNDFPWIIYYFQKSNRFVEQVIGNTEVEQGLSAGNKATTLSPFVHVKNLDCIVDMEFPPLWGGGGVPHSSSHWQMRGLIWAPGCLLWMMNTRGNSSRNTTKGCGLADLRPTDLLQVWRRRRHLFVCSYVRNRGTGCGGTQQ